MYMLNRAKELAYNTIEMPNFLEVKKDTFKNGLNLFYIDGGDLDICHLELIFEAGTKVQSKPLQAALCNAMLLEGTLKSSADEIHNQIDAYGAYTNLDVNADRAIVSLYTLNKYFDTVVPIFINAIKNANFPEKEFTILKEQRRQSFRINSEKVDFTARNIFFGHIYKNHSYGQIAVLENFDTIQREDLEAFHALHYKAANFKTYLSGKTPPNAKEILEDLLGDWTLSKQNPRVLFTKKTSIAKIHIPKKGALQSAIKIGCVSLTSHDKDYFELKFLAVILGGYFGSRLMNNIREDKGLTYGIGAMCVQKEEAGCFVISTEVKGESVQLALTEIYKELKRLREELIPQEEINLVKSYVMGQILAASDGSFAQAKLLKNLHTNALDFDFYKSYQIVLNELNPQDLMDMANKYLKEEDLCEVVVGVIS